MLTTTWNLIRKMDSCSGTYRNSFTNKDPEAVSAFDNEIEEGVDSGPCPFIVNGVTGEKFEYHRPEALPFSSQNT